VSLGAEFSGSDESEEQLPESREVESISPEKVRKPGLSPRNTLWRDVIEIVFLIVIIYTLVNLSTARAVVEGSSMQPNFETGQLVIVNRFAYYFNNPERGDVIVLHNPKNANEDFIKRVVGLPGEIVEIKEGRVYANGIRLEEPYIENFCANCDKAWTLGPDEYFVLGDNRRNSHDSHSFGPIKRDLIVGQAWIRYWPPKDFALIHHPDYGPIPSFFNPTPTPIPSPTPFVTPSPTEDRDFMDWGL
jgi:signal peptidase I